MAERRLCSKLLMNMLSVSVAVVLEILTGRNICGIKLFERSISRKWSIPRLCVYISRFKSKFPVRIVLFCLF